MMRSLYSGVSGLKVHQTKMDVIGNNIANVNTVGFKASNVVFSDVFYQKLQSATGPNAETGSAGTNAMQIGLGSSVSAIRSSISVTGGAQRTDEALDLMINGSSFFIVKNGGTNYFTKAGAFDIDASGTLATASGATVMGWQVDPKDPTKIVQEEVSELKIMSAENLYAQPEATTQAYITGNIDKMDTQVSPTGTGKSIALSFYDDLGYAYTAVFKVKQQTPATGTTAETNKYIVEATDIRDKDGNSIFAVKNADGTYSASGVKTFKLGDATYTAAVNTTSGEVTLTSSGTTPVMEFNGATGEFKGIGAASSTNKSISLTVGDTTATNNPFKAINVDFSAVTMYSSSGSSALEAFRGSSDGLGAGKKLGTMTGVNIDGAGKIYGKYDNGDTKLLGQIAVADFANPAGLESVGNSLFAATQNSGDFDGVGKDISATGGDFTAGVLEMSNVDLAAQFTEMITTQRGFQANSRIITTSDTLLEELINLKR